MDDPDISRGQDTFFQDEAILRNLPPEIMEIIRQENAPNFLDAIAFGALIPSLTLRFFTHFENIFADSCARWISHLSAQTSYIQVLGSFARVLRFAPHLQVYLDRYLRSHSPPTQDPTSPDPALKYLSITSQDDPTSLSTTELQQLLLAAFRLLSFDRPTYCRAISTSRVQDFLAYEDVGVRYLAIRVFVQLLSASELKMEAMIEKHIGRDKAINGDFDGRIIDYVFLSLYEVRCGKGVEKMRRLLQRPSSRDVVKSNSYSPLVSPYGTLLLPRPDGPPSKPTSLILTSTTALNMENFARSLLSSSPILIHGLAGAGKTSLVNDFARELGKVSTLVTLHLNEQTDAKMLIGMYATDSSPGTFSWRPGVLTTAVREGRWVFIEDLDRAPNEVISVILPLIERHELLIPSREETIHAAPGFRLIASVRTSVNVDGDEIPPSTHMLGARLWTRVGLKMPSRGEFQEIIDGLYPLLHRFLPGILAVYDRLAILSRTSSFTSKSKSSTSRPISPRDLLKWCRRLNTLIVESGSQTGAEAISESTLDEMFLEAADCFAGSFSDDDARKVVIRCIAEELNISPQRVEHFLDAHVPRYEDLEKVLIVGRARIRKHQTGNRITKSHKRSRPFANTTHAKRLLEQVGVALKMAEPVLLVGETGIGKTTVVQQLADALGFKLTAVNLSQQSEVGDLLGGFKPVNVRSLAVPLKEEFDELFATTGISASKNQKYLEQIGKCMAKSQWTKVSKLLHEAPRMFDKILSDIMKLEDQKSRDSSQQPVKRRKTESKLQSLLALKPRWTKFAQDLEQFDIQLSGESRGFAFSFVEGNIVKAVRNGEWVLLDEINLASPDTLESIADLLQSGTEGSPSILLSETGQIERIEAHPDFRIFAAMNPATDIGKRDLPMSLRSRFTEIYVDSPDKNLDDLLAVITAYLKNFSTSDERAAHDVARLYMNTKQLADGKYLVDGADQVPHFSLRTLTRVLSYVTEIAPLYGLRRALYEGFAMGFLTLLNRDSEQLLMPLIDDHLLNSHRNPQALLAQTPRRPDDGKPYVKFSNKKGDRQYWMLQGCEIPQQQPHYIITPFVERNLLNLVRATSTRRFPVLIQGPTSAGKTSMIEYLAKFSGNKFVRINNHEHTDLQEYLGTYVSGADGQLRFQEGLLVQALRKGHWIVLDELNLAPTDVLEALNRLLDDNRELLVPETQEVVRPHENFMLFATQNPPGLYGGRKTLSRAFRNRFLELHFDDIPEDELEFILQHRSQKTAPSDCRRIVTVYKELSRLRQSNRLFEQKDSFATLRDLFRWALRDADNREQLAANGYMLLGERVRKPEERLAVKEIIEKVMKVSIDPAVLYDPSRSPDAQLYNATSNKQGVVWTRALSRLFILVAQALRNNEPVLLVGETGCGKTTVCQMLADAFSKELHIVNAHQNTETGDLIGAQRPIRNRAAILSQLHNDLVEALRQHMGTESQNSSDKAFLLNTYLNMTQEQLAKVPGALQGRIEAGQIKATALFEWSDGSLVQAMKEGQYFLLDEISLADDSVLERLNSVLESHRTLLLAEKGIENSLVEATEGFQFLATMNPGGDYGKRELSPALRNRFTEIWVPSLSEVDDILDIVEGKLRAEYKSFAGAVVAFAEWFGQTYRSAVSQAVSIRDVLAWTSFVNQHEPSETYFAIIQGAAMVYIDTLGANPAALLAINPESILKERSKCLQQLGTVLGCDVRSVYDSRVDFIMTETTLTFGAFSIAKTPAAAHDVSFAFDAPTTKLNAMRVVRALQVKKPILIEGSPGVGKTTLIAALAGATGNRLTRINLSEQTDLMDLFGSDAPVEGGEAGNFAWHDAPFLQAMQNGEWVLLDEMNLASQSVLEGLNACLDHRGEVYVSELDQTFKRHPNFTVFAAQNPHHQGGGRKGLPSSFVNRFTVVYADVFRNDDLTMICRQSFPSVEETIMSNLIKFVSILEHEVVYARRFGSQGGPWEFNLRDTLRWLQLLNSKDPLLMGRSPSDFLNIIFRHRFRTPHDREGVDRIFEQVFLSKFPFRHLYHNMAPDFYQVGIAYLSRHDLCQRLEFPGFEMRSRLSELESVMICVQQNLPCILVGPAGSGKSSLIQHAAAAAGADLWVFPLNSEIDTMDLVGGFEQVDPQRASSAFFKSLIDFLDLRILSSIPGAVPPEALNILDICKYMPLSPSQIFNQLEKSLMSLQYKTALPELDEFLRKCQSLGLQSLTMKSARFEWVDGILINALQQGKWLVLDNANLCSSSVLDRLNSLLEPNGFLSINEHSGSNGEPKIVRPHPDFRLFLTMDPRFGELSRAMRNRSIEIYLDLPRTDVTVASQKSSLIQPDTKSDRFGAVLDVFADSQIFESDFQTSLSVAFDNLAFTDIPLLSRFAQALKDGLADHGDRVSQVVQVIARHIEATRFGQHEGFINDVHGLYDGMEKLMNLSPGFTKAQIIHPLSNSPLVPLVQQASKNDECYWLGVLLDIQLNIHDARDFYQSQALALQTLKPSQMNRLQRSMVHERVSVVSNDSTSRVSEFLSNSLESLSKYMMDYRGNSLSWQVHARSLKSIMRFWWDSFRLAISSGFEEAAFQAHLSIGKELFADEQVEQNLPGLPVLMETFQARLQQDFDFSFKLSTGLSMELLWLKYRPVPISSQETLQTLLDIESLADRFDALRWKISISPGELGEVVTSLTKAYRLVLISDVNGQSLVQTLRSELDALEAVISATASETTPHFSGEFETLRQYNTLKAIGLKVQPEDIASNSMFLNEIVLGQASTKSMLHLVSSTESSRKLNSIDYLCGAQNTVQLIKNSLSASLMHRILTVHDVDLKALRLLETELPIFGKQLIQSSTSISQIPLVGLNNILTDIMVGVLEAHDQHLAINFGRWLHQLLDGGADQTHGVGGLDLQQLGSSIPDHVQQVLDNYFVPAALSIAASMCDPADQLKRTSSAWILFSIGLMVLYVPDRAYDPDKKQRLQRERHLEVKEELEKRLRALRHFDRMFTGQESSLRCQLVEEEISDWGEPTEALQKVYRPEASELDQLQGEFNNLLKTVIQSRPQDLVNSYFTTGEDLDSQQLRLLQANMGQIIHRISQRFRGYGDMTMPAISMLHCLQIGLNMAETAVKIASSEANKIKALTQMTPFLGGSLSNSITDIGDQPFEVLANIALLSSVEGPRCFDSATRRLVFDIFHSSYEQWSQKLEADRAETQSKSGLYRFKGSAEDEEEEDQEQFNELFPTYEEDVAKSASNGDIASSRNTAIIFAGLHSKIFLPLSTGVDEVLSFLRQISSRVGSLFGEDNAFSESQMVETLLSGVTVLLDEQINSLSSVTTSDSYNFYVDAHLPEVRKLVQLVHQIQQRFHELQQVDEIAHMQPLEDVLISCKELLEFRHTEPLAKIITKVEKVHGFMHEWQFGGWASRANSVLPVYDRLTATIVSWRRLELSTWSKLFEMENRQCVEDAKSWWFIAYQVIIAAPLSLLESELELKNYSQKLLKDLEIHFGSAIHGQFTQRLEMVKQLQKHLELIIIDFPSLKIINTSIVNFLGMYSRYEQPIMESLRKGRQALEKAMKDVILLASWKDTNIVALRDSARRSHHKLFKLVRKYRALLAQPVDQILNQEIPGFVDTTGPPPTVVFPESLPSVDEDALALCSNLVPDWSQKSKRFTNISQTVIRMDRASQLSSSKLDGSEYLESFVSNIVTFTAELQKATPSFLTEENKDTVKHLKSRKRKLFADTLKELRQMGISYNLGTSALEKQSSTSVILADVPHLQTILVLEKLDLETYYHKVLDVLPRAREAARDHSEDLSGAEVIRSIGFLEGLLQLVLKQRSGLADAVANAIGLETVKKQIRALWAPGTYDIGSVLVSSNYGTMLKWLPTILRVALRLVDINTRLGKVDHVVVQEVLSSWIEKADQLLRIYQELPELPEGIQTSMHEGLRKDVETAIQALEQELKMTIETRPELAYILKQIPLWMSTTSESLPAPDTQATTLDLDAKIFQSCDSLLVAVEAHSKSIDNLPESAEDSSWLVRNNTCLNENISTLRSNRVTKQIENLFELLTTIKVDDGQTSSIVGALFAIAYPIIDEYYRILLRSVARYAEFHRATCKMTYVLAKTFTQIASRGFCTPSEKSDEQSDQTDKLEGGTGLGEGEGAEDISKDIQDDEDLTELAQEPDSGEKNEIEDEKDAVDMADQDMEGQTGEGEEKEDEDGSGDEEDDVNDLDEEAGDVDDLDPTAVDEKMWDGDGEDADKDQEGDESKGTKDKDNMVAAQDNQKQNEEGEGGEDAEDEEPVGAEEEEAIQKDEGEKHDPHAEEGEALDLPEEMELDGDEKEDASDNENGMDDLSDMQDDVEEAKDQSREDDMEGEGEDAAGEEDQNIGSDLDVVDLDEKGDEQEEEGGEETEQAGEKSDENVDEEQPRDEDKLLQDQGDDAVNDAENKIPSDAIGTGEDQVDEEVEDDQTSSSKAQREKGAKGGDASEEHEEAAEDGDSARQATGEAMKNETEETQDSAETQPFKKLGDALERWHRQQSKIQDTLQQQEKNETQPGLDDDEYQEFQHLQDEDAEADTQALGTATEDQAHAMDESMAIDSESKELPDTFQPGEVEQNNTSKGDNMEVEEPLEPHDPSSADAREGQTGAMLRQANPNDDVDSEMSDLQERSKIEEEVEEVDHQLLSTHIASPSSQQGAAAARQLWLHYTSLTHSLSLSLTEHLRLILAPTLATKLRGDFRTGKRLNMKRIIPYIASSYRRDKIWLRRSQPSKRAYQILLAVDDSASMADSGVSPLALATLAMLSTSLSMLEAGQLAVLAFGNDVHVAHGFDIPFSNDAGPKVFQAFNFDQSKTDITRLVRETISLFRAARQTTPASSAGAADLWQLALIISDGVCSSSEHAPIARLLREAEEERIMVVFIVIDDMQTSSSSSSSSSAAVFKSSTQPQQTQQTANTKPKTSVLDLKEARFVTDTNTGNQVVKIERYLDTFPFRYYLIVRDVRELPGALANLLRLWFAEVVGGGT